MDEGKMSTRVQIVIDESELLRLAPAWDDLYARAHRPFVTQSFEWVWCVWKTLMRGEHLRFIFVWYQDRLVLVWPGMITRHNRFWKAEVPVATNADYVDFLAEDSPEAESFARLAWQNRALDAHLMVVGMVRVTSLLHKVLTSQGARPIGHTTPAYFVE